MRRTRACYDAVHSDDLDGLVAEKVDALRHYDVLGMDRVAAIVMWGRSGSHLLASYFDGHEDVILLPGNHGYDLYSFFYSYQSLPLLDKLLAYACLEPDYPCFFEGPFAISRLEYYAAVQAIIKFSDGLPDDFLESRRAFFLFVHLAYHLALGRKAAGSRPLIVYAQHWWNNTLAKRLVEDFPKTKFVHTIRDPISSCDATFHFHYERLSELLPYTSLRSQMNTDTPQLGMESRTKTIRFEDLHSHLEAIMRDLADWLALDYQATLLQSTFNGIPYVVKRDGKAWSGPRLDHLQRVSRYLSVKDRALLFAVFHENFVEWDYACPKIFRHRFVRCAVFFPLLPLPTKMEITGAKVVFRRTILPALKQGKVGTVLASLIRIVRCRLQIIRLLLPAFVRRLIARPTLLQAVRIAPRQDRSVAAAGRKGPKQANEAFPQLPDKKALL